MNTLLRVTSLLTMVRIIQSIATLISGLVIGFAYAWKPAIVGMGACYFTKSCPTLTFCVIM